MAWPTSLQRLQAKTQNPLASPPKAVQKSPARSPKPSPSMYAKALLKT